MRTQLRLVLALTCLLLPRSSPAPAYMKLGDIKGEATDTDHRDWSNVESFSKSFARISATSATGTTTSQIRGELTVSKELDRSSPHLAELAANGKLVPQVEIHLTRQLSAAAPVVVLKYELKNVLVTSYSIGGSGQASGATTEQVTLVFEQITITYVRIDPRTGRPLDETTTTSRFELPKL